MYEKIISSVVEAKIIDQKILTKKIMYRYRLLTRNILKNRKDIEHVIYMLDSVTENSKEFPKIIFAYIASDTVAGKNKMGYYDPTDSIIMNINPSEIMAEDKLEAEINLAAFFTILEMNLQHELIHRQQYMKIKEDKKEKYDEYLAKSLTKPSLSNSRTTKDYLGDIHEVMTHANDVIQELKSNGYTKKEIKEIIKQPSKISASDSFTLDDYKKEFGSNHPIYKKLLQYAISYAAKL